MIDKNLSIKNLDFSELFIILIKNAHSGFSRIFGSIHLYKVWEVKISTFVGK